MIIATIKTLSAWVERILWATGAACVGAYVLAGTQTSSAQVNALAALESEWRAAATIPDTALWSEKRVKQYASNRVETMSPLGLLTVPRLGVRVAVFNGTSDAVLNLGAGRVLGTGQVGGEGNLAVAAHRDGFFRGLKDVEIGDEINVKHTNGVDHYVVTELSIVDPTDVTVLNTTRTSTITLITCYPFYFVGSAPQRFIVRAEMPADDAES